MSPLLVVAPAIAESPPELPSWRAKPEAIALAVERAKKANRDLNYDESQVTSYVLPDPLVAADGNSVARETWPARRAEILNLFRTQMYGTSLRVPENIAFKIVEEIPSDLDGLATRKLVEISFDTPHAGRYRFRTQVYIPNAAAKPVPAIVLLHFEGLTYPLTVDVIRRGYALAILDRTQIALDDENKYRDGVINAFQGNGPLPADCGRAIAAWAWAGSRVLDYLLTDPAIDRHRIGVAGHSRMGKTALWAAAADDRFAMVLSNNSGCGGAALARRNYGETVALLNKVRPHWFCENHHAFKGRENELPFDQHMLIALVAPRLVYVTSADEDLPADPRGEFLSCVAASPVYELLGVSGLKGNQLPGRVNAGKNIARKDEPATMPPLDQPLQRGYIGYHIRSGAHNLTEYDWQQFLNFADQHQHRDAAR